MAFSTVTLYLDQISADGYNMFNFALLMGTLCNFHIFIELISLENVSARFVCISSLNVLTEEICILCNIWSTH